MNAPERERLLELQRKWIKTLEEDDPQRCSYTLEGREVERDAWRHGLVCCIRESEEALAIREVAADIISSIPPQGYLTPTIDDPHPVPACIVCGEVAKWRRKEPLPDIAYSEAMPKDRRPFYCERHRSPTGYDVLIGEK